MGNYMEIIGLYVSTALQDMKDNFQAAAGPRRLLVITKFHRFQ